MTRVSSIYKTKLKIVCLASLTVAVPLSVAFYEPVLNAFLTFVSGFELSQNLSICAHEQTSPQKYSTGQARRHRCDLGCQLWWVMKCTKCSVVKITVHFILYTLNVSLVLSILSSSIYWMMATFCILSERNLFRKCECWKIIYVLVRQDVSFSCTALLQNWKYFFARRIDIQYKIWIEILTFDCVGLC